MMCESNSKRSEAHEAIVGWGEGKLGLSETTPRSRRPRVGLRSAVLLAASLVFLVAVSCKDRDDRQEIRNQLGEPDERVVQGADPFWSEIWYYYDEGVAYEFRRSAPKCGGGRDYYLYAQYIIGAKGALQRAGRPDLPGQESDTILGP